MKSDYEYNNGLNQFSAYSELNRYVMIDTVDRCENDSDLIEAIKETKKKQYIVFEDEIKGFDRIVEETTNIIVSKKRSFEAAKEYKGKKIAVLNFANNHVIGGSPFSSGAQEESICRLSTLYPCLQKEKERYYKYHKKLYNTGRLTDFGNDDLIYSPDIVVFKSDESAPKILKKEDWFTVDVITSCAPEMQKSSPIVYNEEKVFNRLMKVFEVAKRENVEVLILGAWGCGAFKNPPEKTALFFKKLTKMYKFDTIEFAVFCRDGGIDANFHIFKEVILNES